MASQNEEHEKMVNNMRKKQAQAISELEEQVAAVKKSKGKLEKDIHHLNAEVIDSSEQVEEVKKLKVRSNERGQTLVLAVPCSISELCISEGYLFIYVCCVSRVRLGAMNRF